MPKMDVRFGGEEHWWVGGGEVVGGEVGGGEVGGGRWW